MRVEVVPQVVLNVSRHADEYAALKKKKDAAHQAGAQDLQGSDAELCPVNFVPIGVDRIADDQRDGDVKDYAGQDAGNPDDQRCLVRSEETCKFAQIAHESDPKASLLQMKPDGSGPPQADQASSVKRESEILSENYAAGKARQFEVRQGVQRL